MRVLQVHYIDKSTSILCGYYPAGRVDRHLCKAVPDLVRPGITGYLAEPENAKDFCNGIVQLLEDEPLRSYMSEQCRAIAIKEYALELLVQRYIELYRHVLQNDSA